MRSFRSPPKATHRGGFFISGPRSFVRFSQRKTKPRTSGTAFKASDYVPIWSQQHTNTTNLIAEMVFGQLGVTDLRSYFQQFAIPIGICTGIGIGVGAYHWGLQGAVLGVLVGLAAPAVSVYLLLVVVYAAILLFAFIAVWAVILWSVFFVLTH